MVGFHLLAAVPAALDDVGVDGALDEVVGLAGLARLFLEYADECLADDFALLLGIGDALEVAQEAGLAVNVHQVDAELVAEDAADLLRLVLAHQAMVHEHAGKLLADGAVDEHCADGGIDAAGHGEQDALVADGLADGGDGLLDEGVGRPFAGCADFGQEGVDLRLAHAACGEVEDGNSEGGDVGGRLAANRAFAAVCAALEDYGLGRKGGYLLRRGGAWEHLAIDVEVPNDLGCGLAVDSAEVDDGDGVFLH